MGLANMVNERVRPILNRRTLWKWFFMIKKTKSGNKNEKSRSGLMPLRLISNNLLYNSTQRVELNAVADDVELAVLNELGALSLHFGMLYSR